MVGDFHLTDAKSLHQYFISPAKKAEARTVLSGDSLEVSFGALLLERFVSFVHIVSLLDKAENNELLGLC